MDSISNVVLKRKNNVHVDNNTTNNVYVDVDIKKLNESIDKHKAIGELVAEKLGRPNNVELYIRLSYLNRFDQLLEWCALALDAFHQNRTKDVGGYFYGIVRNLGRVK